MDTGSNPVWQQFHD